MTTGARRKASVLLALVLASCLPWASAQADTWRVLVRAMNYAALNRAEFEFMCTRPREEPLPTPMIDFCAKRGFIPHSVWETAALPYLKQYVPEPLGRQAIAALTTAQAQQLSRILIEDARSGVKGKLTPEQSELLEKRNRSEYGRALNAFAHDPDQKVNVIRAAMAYQPELPKKGFIAGRAATNADIASGDAAFVLPSGPGMPSKPMAIRIPQFAYSGKGAKKELVIIIQTETAQGREVIGARTGDGHDIVGLRSDFEFIGGRSMRQDGQ